QRQASHVPPEEEDTTGANSGVLTLETSVTASVRRRADQRPQAPASAVFRRNHTIPVACCIRKATLCCRCTTARISDPGEESWGLRYEYWMFPSTWIVFGGRAK